ncbi:hypothetical protein PMIN02_000494 [Paraphaeosphaeria minitans]
MLCPARHGIRLAYASSLRRHLDFAPTATSPDCFSSMSERPALVFAGSPLEPQLLSWKILRRTRDTIRSNNARKGGKDAAAINVEFDERAYADAEKREGRVSLHFLKSFTSAMHTTEEAAALLYDQLGSYPSQCASATYSNPSPMTRMMPMRVLVLKFNRQLIGSGMSAHTVFVKIVIVLSTCVVSMNFSISMHFRPGTNGSQLRCTGVHCIQITTQNTTVDVTIKPRFAWRAQRSHRLVPPIVGRKSNTDTLTNMRPDIRKNSPKPSV